MRISDWSSDVCSSDLYRVDRGSLPDGKAWFVLDNNHLLRPQPVPCRPWVVRSNGVAGVVAPIALPVLFPELNYFHVGLIGFHQFVRSSCQLRSEEHTSELQSLMRISYAVFCLKQHTS